MDFYEIIREQVRLTAQLAEENRKTAQIVSNLQQHVYDLHAAIRATYDYLKDRDPSLPALEEILRAQDCDHSKRG